VSSNSYSTDQPSDEGPADSDNVRELAVIPAVEVTTRAALMLMSAAAEKVGPEAGGDEQFRDLAEARQLITALAGLLDASGPDLGLHRKPIADGLKALQLAFREASAFPDEPGRGPGEKYTGPVKG